MVKNNIDLIRSLVYDAVRFSERPPVSIADIYRHIGSKVLCNDIELNVALNMLLERGLICVPKVDTPKGDGIEPLFGLVRN